MNVSAKRLLTVAILTNPLSWFIAMLAVGLVVVAIAVACVAAGSWVLLVMYRYLRDEWTNPPRKQAVPLTLSTPPMSPMSERKPVLEPVFGLVIPKPTAVTNEQTRVILAQERDDTEVVETPTPSSAACAATPTAVRSSVKPRTGKKTKRSKPVKAKSATSRR